MFSVFVEADSPNLLCTYVSDGTVAYPFCSAACKSLSRVGPRAIVLSSSVEIAVGSYEAPVSIAFHVLKYI